MSQPDEFELIRMLTEHKQSTLRQQQLGVVVGIGDDAAVLDLPPSFQLVLSCDTMVETVHFLPHTMGDADVGYKALASNISDMAAMGAIPAFALVSLCVPKHYSPERLKEIYNGLYECAETYQVAIVGGDTSSTPMYASLSVTIAGRVERGQALLRSTAQTGDAVFITGCLGCSAAGLDVLMNHSDIEGIECKYDQLIQAHRRPVPQVEAGRLLILNSGCHALNDVSDGLASECWEIAEASGKGLFLYEDRLPVREDLQAYAAEMGGNALDWILFGGEDYQLVGTIPPDKVEVMKSAFSVHNLPFYVIGEVRDDFQGVQLVERQGTLRTLEKRGYNHFG